MKPLTIFIICSLILFNSQNENLYGTYQSHFGEKITIHQDSTFLYTYRFGFSSSWTKGRWTNEKDTITFIAIPVFDTLSYHNANGNTQIDTLVLSLDETSEIIDFDKYVESQLISGGQNRHPNPTKLFHKKNKLIHLSENGSLRKKKVRLLLSRKKKRSWFKKLD